MRKLIHGLESRLQAVQHFGGHANGSVAAMVLRFHYREHQASA
jgi:hypothetical protein